MGACASKLSILKSVRDTAPPEDLASRDFSPSDEKVKQQDIRKPVAADDDEPKRQMLGHLLKEAEPAGGVKENNGKESLEVKQEQGKLQEEEHVKPETDSSVADAELKSKEEVKQERGKLQEDNNVKPATDSSVADADLKSKEEVKQEQGKLQEDENVKPETDSSVADAELKPKEVKEAQDVKPVSEDVETAVSQKATEEKPVENATEFEASENLGMEKPDEIEKPCLEITVEKKTAVEDAEESGVVKEAEMLCSEKLEAGMTTAEEEKKEEQKPASAETEMEAEIEIRMEEKDDKKPALVEEEEANIKEAETSRKLEVHGTQEKCEDEETVKTIKVEVEKLAAAGSTSSTTNRAGGDQPGAPGDDSKPEVKTSS